MKTVKKVVFILIALVTIAACTPEEITYKNVTPNKTNFHLEATATQNIQDPQGNLHLEFTEISECNLAESILIVLDSKRKVLNDRGDFMIPEGNIDFLVPNIGCSLVATFYGKGIIEEDQLILNATIDVEYGTGALSADGGELSLNIVGVQTPDQLMKYTIEIDGHLENRNHRVN